LFNDFPFLVWNVNDSTILLNKIFGVDNNCTDYLIHDSIFVHDLEDKTTTHQRNLHWDEELLVPRDLTLLLLQKHFSLQFIPFMIDFYVGIDFWFSDKFNVHWYDFLRGKHSNVQLIELGLDLRWLQILFVLWVGVVLDCDLLITSTTDGDTQFEVSRNLAKIFFTFGVAQDDILVHQRVVWH